MSTNSLFLFALLFFLLFIPSPSISVSRECQINFYLERGKLYREVNMDNKTYCSNVYWTRWPNNKLILKNVHKTMSYRYRSYSIAYNWEYFHNQLYQLIRLLKSQLSKVPQMILCLFDNFKKEKSTLLVEKACVYSILYDNMSVPNRHGYTWISD